MANSPIIYKQSPISCSVMAHMWIVLLHDDDNNVDILMPSF